LLTHKGQFLCFATPSAIARLRLIKETPGKMLEKTMIQQSLTAGGFRDFKFHGGVAD
jgi:hypothetical protein